MGGDAGRRDLAHCVVLQLDRSVARGSNWNQDLEFGQLLDTMVAGIVPYLNPAPALPLCW